MKPANPLKIRKDCVIRARVDAQIKNQAQRCALMLGVDESDIVRLALRQFTANAMNNALALNGAR